MFRFAFISNIIKINHFIFRYSSSSVLHTFPTFAPYGYDIILSNVYKLLSLLLLSAILVISSVPTLWASLLNLCCDFNIVSLFSKHFFVIFKLKYSFYYTVFVPLAFYHYCHHLLNKNKVMVYWFHNLMYQTFFQHYLQCPHKYLQF